MREAEKYVVGIDFGTLSGRAVVVRISDGEELGSAVHEYRHGVMERTLSAGDDRRLPPDWALQNPHDYIEVLQQAVPQAVAASSVDPADIIGVGTDFTASTVIPVLADGTPLCELPEFEAEPHAYVKLWKHHAAQPQADRIIQLAQERGEKWLSRYGGLVSSEWAFPKALQIFEQAREVYDCMDRLVEAADWIVWQLTGNYTCNAATAGYKDQLQDGSHPSPEYLAALAPGFGDFATTKLSQDVSQLGESAGGLSAQAAAWTGLPEGIAVAVGNIDAHVAAPAAKAIGSGQLLAIMGTSSCQIVNDDQLREVPGMAGVVDGGVVAGKWGYEMGQSGVGDIFAWFVQHCVPASYQEAAAKQGLGVHEYLTQLAAEQQVGQHGLVALDWHSGNRSVLVDHDLSGVIIGQTLQTTPEEQYRALIEATAFGARTIIDTFRSAGVQITELVAAGGLLKNEFLMQVYADVLRLPISVIDTDQPGSLGSAIHAAVAAGSYPSVPAASEAMGKKREGVYQPNLANSEVYDQLYRVYQQVHDYFGREQRDLMHSLRALRRQVSS